MEARMNDRRHTAAPPPTLHLCIVQPAGYVHSLAFLDPVRYVRWQLGRLGVPVTLAKNRLRGDAVNLVFGAHLGFDPALRERHACVFVNLEQLGPGGAALPPAYLELLRGSGVVDYDARNVQALGLAADDVPLLALAHAPYLEGEAAPLPLAQRSIDLLFFGSMNPRRAALLSRIEAAGTSVAVFDHPLYAAERDAWIRQARAVLNLHHYDSQRFEQVRVQHVLSLGTPVVSERGPGLAVPPAFEPAVTWLAPEAMPAFFAGAFREARFEAAAATQLEAWRASDTIECFADLVGFCRGYAAGHARHAPAAPWRPQQLNLGSGKSYRPGALNIDIVERTEPDLVLDLAAPAAFPITGRTRFGVPFELAAGSVQRIVADNVLEHVADLPAMLTNLVALLEEGGELDVEVPYEKSLAAWQDPTHLRAMNENSWLYVTEWFWYLGWFEHRFEIVRSAWLDERLQPCAKDHASFMRLALKKVLTTPRERTAARTMQAGLGDFSGDDAYGWRLPPAAAEAAFTNHGAAALAA
jgi:hypothetical protein